MKTYVLHFNELNYRLGKRDMICAEFVRHHLKTLPREIRVTISKERFEGCRILKLVWFCTNHKFLWSYPNSDSYYSFFKSASIFLKGFLRPTHMFENRLYYQIEANSEVIRKEIS